MSPFYGRHVCVTGAGGSIGSQLCARAAEEGAERLTLVSLTEGGLYTTDKFLRKTYPATEFIPVVGSVGTFCQMRRALEGVDIVCHAGGHKHVPLCESNAVEAIHNNAFGTLALATAARQAGVEQFCMVSSDKAVRPASIMGATKRLAELLIAECDYPGFFIVRFGNVMDSAGSVLPLWRSQIAAGEAITITDERCERFFMSIASAVGLITSVIGLKPKKGTFVLDMGKPRKLIDLAQDLIYEMRAAVPIKVIGLRPGEKLTEELHHGGELKPTAVDKVFLIDEPPKPPLNPQMLRQLAEARDECDTERAVGLLWQLVQ